MLAFYFLQWLPLGKEENELGNWKFLESKNASSKFPDFKNSNGNSVLELISTPRKITGVHYVQPVSYGNCHHHDAIHQGVMVFHDVCDNDKDVRGAQIRVGVYIWPFRQLVANRDRVVDLFYEAVLEVLFH
ncbi:RING/U-box superfamily protein [Striga asiatica]|uniref:RING/U-box superfamily protein n=1 Tax=Striga asiatica TaxID=4170 RepID=A0A5A7R7F0_STRAF|nr:RING/U-box superfamily protein [Striga asiatica]